MQQASFTVHSNVGHMISHLLSNANSLLIKQHVVFWCRGRILSKHPQSKGTVVTSSPHTQKLTASTGRQWVIAAMQPQSISHFSPSHFIYSNSVFFLSVSTTRGLLFSLEPSLQPLKDSVLPPGRSARSSHWGSMCRRTGWSPALLLMRISWADALSMRVDGETHVETLSVNPQPSIIFITICIRPVQSLSSMQSVK